MGWSKGKNVLVAGLFEEYNPDNKKKRKGSAFQTVSYKHREALKVLLATLGATTPHFVRCIIPNEIKSSKELWGDLVLHQLRCNGVLEGIRICRKGFPSRMPFNDFKQRYSIIAASAIPTGFVDGKVASEKLIGALQLDESEFRIGHTKVFFRSGIIGELEDMRDERLSKILSQFQAYCKGSLQRVEYKKMRDRRVGLACLQRNIRKYFGMKNWTWWKLYVQVLPMLTVAAAEEDKKKMLDELNNTSSALANAEEMVTNLQTAKDGLEAELAAAQERLEEEERKATMLGGDKKKQKAQIDDLTAKNAEAADKIAKLETEKSSQAKQIEALNAEVAAQGDAHGKLSKDKKAVEENLANTTDALQTAEDKGKKLGKEKAAVEEKLKETEEKLAKEKSAKEKLDKEKKKVEGTLRETEATLADTASDLAIAKDTVVKKEKLIKEANENIEDLEKTIKNLQKKVAEGLARISDLEEELEAEKKAKNKVEKEKAEV